VTDTSQDAAELQRLASEIIASGHEQPNTFVCSTEQFDLTVALLKVVGWPRGDRRRSRHCRSNRPRSLRRARDRARIKEHEAAS
jgi:hypothetical protein